MLIRIARRDDLAALTAVMDAAIGKLQSAFLSPDQVRASRAVMGLDTQLVDDGAYFIAEIDGRIAGCGGWSRRATLYGGDHSAALRDATLLDPSKDAARVRAMYTHPDFARRGVGAAILAACESAARDAGFTRVELMATLAGEPLYRACGFREIERIVAEPEPGIVVPLVRMGKDL